MLKIGMKYTAVSPDGRIVTCEIGNGTVGLCRRQGSDGIGECIETDDRSGLEAHGIELALENWWHKGWAITAEPD